MLDYGKGKKNMAKGNIYNFKIDQKTKKKVETKRKNKETGEEEVVIVNKTVNDPVEFTVKRPTRRVTDEAETHYAVELSNALKKGIISKAMLAKQYSDTGGPLTENETKEVLVLIREIGDLENEYKLLHSTESANKKDKKIEEIEEQIIVKRKLLLDLETATQGIYQHTADSKAERSLLLWYTIALSYVVKNGEEEPYFKGAIYEEQVEDLYTKEESEGFDNDAVNKLMKVVSYWFYSQSTDIKEIEKFLEAADE